MLMTPRGIDCKDRRVFLFFGPGQFMFASTAKCPHAAKLSPQEQCATAFGLVTLKPPF